MPPPASASILGTQAAAKARHRHSALVTRAARDAPYARPPPSQSSDSPYFAGEVASVQGGPQGYASEHSGHDVQGRRRGVTLSGYEPSYAALAGYVSHPAMVLDSGVSPYASLAGQQLHFSPTSLSQPSTPEEAYMVHASILQAGLAREQAAAPSYWMAEPGVSSSQRPVGEADQHEGPATWHEAPGMYTPATSNALGAAPQWAADQCARPTPPGWTVEALYAPGAEEARSLMTRRRSSLDHLRRPSHVGASTAAFFHRVVGAAAMGDIQPMPVGGNNGLPASHPLPSGMGASAPDFVAMGLSGGGSSTSMSFQDPWSLGSASPTSLTAATSSPVFSQGQQHNPDSSGNAYLSHRGSVTSSVGVPSPLREVSESDGTNSSHPSAYVSPASSMHVPTRSGSSQLGGAGSVASRRRSGQSANSHFDRADAQSQPSTSSPLPAPAQGMPTPGDWSAMRHAHGSPLLSPDTELSTGLFAMTYASTSPSYASSASSSHSGLHPQQLGTTALPHAAMAASQHPEQQPATPQLQPHDARFGWMTADEGASQGGSPSHPQYATDHRGESWY